MFWDFNKGGIGIQEGMIAIHEDFAETERASPRGQLDPIHRLRGRRDAELARDSGWGTI